MGEKSKGEFELVLRPTQVIIAACLLLTQMGLIAGVAYMAGRTGAAGATPVSAVSSPAQPPASEKTLIVQPVQAQPEAPPAPAAQPPLPEPSAQVTQVGQALLPPPAFAKTNLYLQVASVDVPAAEEMAKALQSRGFQATLAPGNTDALRRVLVGPYEKPQLPEASRALAELGFDSFPKRYGDPLPAP